MLKMVSSSLVISLHDIKSTPNIQIHIDFLSVKGSYCFIRIHAMNPNIDSQRQNEFLSACIKTWQL